MTLPQLHLAAEAIVAFVDGELAAVPQRRADAHLRECVECRIAVAQQRAAKTALYGARQPDPSDALLARLRGIPMTTEISPPGTVVTVEDNELVFGRPERIAERSRPRRAARPSRGPRATSRRPPDRRPGPSHHPLPMRVLGRGLAGAAAAVVVGMLVATTASTQASGSGVRAPSQNAPVSQAGTTDVGVPSIPEMGGDVDRPLLVRTASVGLAR